MNDEETFTPQGRLAAAGPKTALDLSTVKKLQHHKSKMKVKTKHYIQRSYMPYLFKATYLI